jgi:hypothetical protein
MAMKNKGLGMGRNDHIGEVHQLPSPGSGLMVCVHERRHNVAFFQVDDCLLWFARKRNRRFNGLNAVSDYMNASILEQAIFQNDGSAAMIIFSLSASIRAYLAASWKRFRFSSSPRLLHHAMIGRTT